MGIPAFDDNGNLPPGRHGATPDEVHDALVGRFPTSATRSAIFRYWADHRVALGDIVAVHCQWLAGSFASDKENPADPAEHPGHPQFPHRHRAVGGLLRP